MKLIYITGKFYERETAEYESLVPLGERLPTSRAVFVVDVHKVGTVRDECIVVCLFADQIIAVMWMGNPVLYI